MDSNHSAPAIVIAAIDGCDGLWREVLLGIEEEGIPFLLQHQEFTRIGAAFYADASSGQSGPT